jgi:hypothetical protein
MRLKFLLTGDDGREHDLVMAVSKLPLELKSGVTPTWAEETALAALFASQKLKMIANR